MLFGIITGAPANFCYFFSNPRALSYLLQLRKENAMDTLRLVGVALMSAFGGLDGIPLDLFLGEE